MSTKTAPILEETHALIVNKQQEMKKKHRVKMKISDIIDVIISKNIHMLEKYMGINVDKEKSDSPDNNEKNSNVPLANKVPVPSGAPLINKVPASNKVAAPSSVPLANNVPLAGSVPLTNNVRQAKDENT